MYSEKISLEVRARLSRLTLPPPPPLHPLLPNQLSLQRIKFFIILAWLKSANTWYYLIL